MLDNSKDSYFSNDPDLKVIEKLELVEAYKIENGILLNRFEYKLRKAKESFLKGLFVIISKK